MSQANEAIVHNVVNAICWATSTPRSPATCPRTSWIWRTRCCPRVAGSGVVLHTGGPADGDATSWACPARWRRSRPDWRDRDDERGRDRKTAGQRRRAHAHGNGPASVRLHGPHGIEDGAVVFVMPGRWGIIDDALDKLYAAGVEGRKQGQGEAR
jgi:hypothetical protein